MRGSRLLLALLVLTSLTLVALDGGGPTAALRRGADAVLGPPQRAVGGVVGRVLGHDDESDLARDNARLRALLRDTDALRRRDAELRRLLALEPVGRYPVVPARVVARGTVLGGDTATLDAGSRDGVRAGQTVLTGEGLVGRTTRVGPFTCTVLLLTDPGSTVGGRLARLGGVGLVDGQGADGLRYELVDASAAMKVGDVVTTTGSGTFVPDVPVGRVTRLVTQASALTRVAELEPLVDLGRLDLVGVVVGPARTGTRKPLS
ncbi:MAG: rod shape-determining protein MreC [Frankiales bacterium]|nr:rod shape-determining protein MreC [Frankiales bacterium]